MSGRFVRTSSYRHLFGQPAKPELEFMDIRATLNGDGNHIAANDKFFCYAGVGGGGPVVIQRLDKPGRTPLNAPFLAVHKDIVLDYDWNPFINTLLATGGEDCHIKISNIPEEGLKSTLSDAVVTLEGHERKINILHWHPTANNVIGSASADNTLRVWDIEKSAQLTINNDFGDTIQSFDWNRDGSLLVATSKDLLIRMFDPRAKGAVIKTNGFTGPKGARAIWQSDKGRVIALGSSKQSYRQYGVWDMKMPDKPLLMEDIDQAAGVLVPTFDPDTNVLYAAGKGDGNIRYYEVVDTEPYIHFLSEFRDNSPQKGVCWLPKKVVDVHKCEVMVALRLVKDKITPISFQVPRKSDMFQKDLYPDTYAGIPALTADQWAAGQNKAPQTMSLQPGTAKPSGGSSAAASTASFTPAKSAAQLEKELAAANARIAQLEQELAKLKAQ